jgi:hypothetical protein
LKLLARQTASRKAGSLGEARPSFHSIKEEIEKPVPGRSPRGQTVRGGKYISSVFPGE